MLPELLLIASIGIYDPMDMSGHTMYPSGVKECDKYPRYELPASNLAKLTLPRNILAKDNRLIKSGHYLAGLSIGKQSVLIFDGEREIYELEIFQTEILNRKMKISTSTFYTMDNGDSCIILIQGALKIYAKVNVSD